MIVGCGLSTLMALRSFCDSINSAAGSPATAGSLAKNPDIIRRAIPKSPEGYLLSTPGSDLMNVGSNPTEEIDSAVLFRQQVTETPKNAPFGTVPIFSLGNWIIRHKP